MGKPKKIKAADTQKANGSKIKDDPRLPNKSLFRKDEAANYFGVTVRCIDRWLDHGHLEKEKIVGVVRIPRDSILRCRFRKTVMRPT